MSRRWFSLVFLLCFSCTSLAQTNRLQVAQLRFKQKQYDKVVELLNPYTEQLGTEGFLLLALAYSNQQNHAGEARVLSLLSAKQEENHRWHMLLAQAQLKAASLETVREKERELTTSAIQKLRRVLQLQKGYKPAFDLLVATLLYGRFHSEAREILLEGINRYGQRSELLRALCRLDSYDGFLEQAVTNCRTAIQLAPAYPDNYVYLAQALFDQKELEQAERNLIAAAKRFPKSEFVQWAAGTLFFRKKNFAVADRYFAAAVKLSPNSVRARFGVAQAQYESGQEEKSLENFVKACELDGTTVDVFLAAGGRLKQKGNTKLGELFVRRANTCRRY